MTPAEIEELIKETPKKKRQVTQSDSSVLEQVAESDITIPAEGNLPSFSIPKTLKATPTVWNKVASSLKEILRQGQLYCRIHHESDTKFYQIFMEWFAKYYLFYVDVEIQEDFELSKTLIDEQLLTPTYSLSKRPPWLAKEWTTIKQFLELHQQESSVSIPVSGYLDTNLYLDVQYVSDGNFKPIKATKYR